jgi:hypothetical protein
MSHDDNLRHDANGTNIRPLRSHAEWATWKFDIIGAAEKIAGSDRGIIQAMIDFANVPPEVPPIDATAANGLSASSRARYVESRLSKRQDLIEARSSKYRQLCTLLTSNLHDATRTICSSELVWEAALDNVNYLFIWRTIRDLYSTPSSSSNPVVRNQIAEARFEKTRQAENTFARYVETFKTNYKALSDERRAQYGDANLIHKFIRGLNINRFGFFIQNYELNLRQNANTFTDFAEAVKVVKDIDSSINEQSSVLGDLTSRPLKDTTDGNDRHKGEDVDEAPNSAFLAKGRKRYAAGGDNSAKKKVRQEAYERRFRFQGNCWNCGEQGHRASQCQNEGEHVQDGGDSDEE